MALPPRGGALLVLLGNPEATDLPPLPAGATILPYTDGRNSFIDTEATFYNPEPAWLPRQQSFYASQNWYPEYPPECIIKVSEYFMYAQNVVRINSLGTASVESTYPNNIVSTYNPGPPLYPGGPSYQPAPDPNGDTGNYTGSTAIGSLARTPFPRWYDATPYDMANPSSYDYWQSGFFPLKNHEYTLNPFGGNLTVVCSADLTVNNLDSKVYNEESEDYEYYPFAQGTFNYKQTAKVNVIRETSISNEICCWNDGTVIEGGISYSSIDVTTAPLGSIFDSGHGFYGMTATTGETITEEGSISFSVTISSTFSPPEIEIPTVAGKITFITDFWITSVTAPT